MSVRAYRVNEIKREESPTFNLWHDTKLMDFLESETGFYNGLNQDACGMTEIEVSLLVKAVKKAKSLELDKDQVKSLQADIKWAKENSLDYIQYYCF